MNLGILILASSFVAADVSDATITSSALRSHVEYLASDKLEGRLTGTEGERLATAYAADFFKSLGLKPGGDKDTYFQEFPVSFGSTIGEGSELIFTTSTGKEIKAKVGEEFSPVLGSIEKTPVEGGVVFAGEGRVEGERDDFASIDAKGKIVMLFPAAPRDNYNNSARARAAKEKGAVGVIFVGPTEEGSSKLMLLTRQRGINRDLEIAAACITAELFEKVSGLKYADARKSAAGGYISSSFARGLKAKLTSETAPNNTTGRNVIAILPGNDEKLKDQYIVIGAHIDHVGWGQVGSMSGVEKIHNGADDNASGTSTVLELARYFASTKDNKRSIVFQLYSGEELGLLGSMYWTRNPTVDIKAVTAMINLDMVGRLREDKLTIDGIGTSPDWPALVDKLTGGLDIKKSNGPMSNSDHFSFFRAGIPVLFFHTDLHEHYHRHTDEVDTLNYEGMAKIANLVAEYVRAIDKMSEMVTYKNRNEEIKRTPPKKDDNENHSMGRRVRIGFIPEYGDSGPGVLLAGVSSDSPAQKAGLREGDRILEWDGKKIDSIEGLQEFMMSAQPGKAVTLTVERRGEKIKVTVTPEPVSFMNAA